MAKYKQAGFTVTYHKKLRSVAITLAHNIDIYGKSKTSLQKDPTLFTCIKLKLKNFIDNGSIIVENTEKIPTAANDIIFISTYNPRILNFNVDKPILNSDYCNTVSMQHNLLQIMFEERQVLIQQQKDKNAKIEQLTKSNCQNNSNKYNVMFLFFYYFCKFFKFTKTAQKTQKNTTKKNHKNKKSKRQEKKRPTKAKQTHTKTYYFLIEFI